MLFLKKLVKHQNAFIYYAKYKSSSVTLPFVSPDIFWKIDLKVFSFFSTEHELNIFQKLHYTTTWIHIRLYSVELLLARYSLFLLM